MKYDSEGYELVTYRIEWYAELGYIDGGGIGYWESTKESVKCKSREEAEAVKSKWIKEGKLTKTPWGEWRPNYYYGQFRINCEEVLVE